MQIMHLYLLQRHVYNRFSAQLLLNVEDHKHSCSENLIGSYGTNLMSITGILQCNFDI